MDDDELMKRSRDRYFKGVPRGTRAQPNDSMSGVTEHDGVPYAVQRNTDGVLAVYREADGDVVEVKDWPKELEEY